MSYEETRDEIHTQLVSVSGIGKVFKSHRYVNDWATFLERFKSNGKINLCWFSLVSAPETGLGVGSTDETNELEFIERDETWRIELYYGFQDDDINPSEFDFMKLAEAIEDKFRFLQNLNGKAFRSFPLQRIGSGLWEFLSGVLCHRAEWTLQIQERIQNPNPIT